MRKFCVGVPLGTEVRHDIDVVPNDGCNELIVHFLVADEMRKAVDARIHEVHRVRVIEDVSVHHKPMLMTLVNRRAREIRRKPRRAAVSIVDPDLDEVHLLGGEFLHGFAHLIFCRHFVRDTHVCRRPRPRIRRADTPPRNT